MAQSTLKIKRGTISDFSSHPIRWAVYDFLWGLRNTYKSTHKRITIFIIHQTHYEKSDWSRAFNQFT